MNYLLMLNHIHSKLEGAGARPQEEALTNEDIDLTFNVSSIMFPSTLISYK